MGKCNLVCVRKKSRLLPSLNGFSQKLDNKNNCMYIFYMEFHPIRISDHLHTQPDLTLWKRPFVPSVKFWWTPKPA